VSEALRAFHSVIIKFGSVRLCNHRKRAIHNPQTQSERQSQRRAGKSAVSSKPQNDFKVRRPASHRPGPTRFRIYDGYSTLQSHYKCRLLTLKPLPSSFAICFMQNCCCRTRSPWIIHPFRFCWPQPSRYRRPQIQPLRLTRAGRQSHRYVSQATASSHQYLVAITPSSTGCSGLIFSPGEFLLTQSPAPQKHCLHRFDPEANNYESSRVAASAHFKSIHRFHYPIAACGWWLRHRGRICSR